jgi:hypothetical protein
MTAADRCVACRKKADKMKQLERGGTDSSWMSLA